MGTRNYRLTQKLWTKNFTIATLGTIVSMLGNAVSGFALGLLVLDYTGSTLLYAVFAVVNNIPKVIMPSIAGPYIDRFSRRKVIYTLDFVSSGVYLLLFFLLMNGIKNYAIMLAFCVVIGSIDSVYQVAYDSLYPNLISEGNYSKAYSIASMIYPLAALMTPVAAYVYDIVPDGNGINYMFLFNAVTFFIAAAFETQIKFTEQQELETKKTGYSIQKYVDDFREGFQFLKKEKGLSTIVVYFVINTFVSGATGILLLPYFKGQDALGVMTYTFVAGSSLLGRLIGGIYHYRVRIKPEIKFTIAMCVYITANIIGCAYLFVPVTAMLVLQLISGMICVTSYNIRISSTQNYLSNEVRGRFNGTFQMLTTLGLLLGQLIAGALGDYFDMRTLIIAFSLIDLVAIFAVMFRGREGVKQIYNVSI